MCASVCVGRRGVGWGVAATRACRGTAAVVQGGTCARGARTRLLYSGMITVPLQLPSTQPPPCLLACSLSPPSHGRGRPQGSGGKVAGRGCRVRLPKLDSPTTNATPEWSSGGMAFSNSIPCLQCGPPQHASPPGRRSQVVRCPSASACAPPPLTTLTYPRRACAATQSSSSSAGPPAHGPGTGCSPLLSPPLRLRLAWLQRVGSRPAFAFA